MMPSLTPNTPGLAPPEGVTPNFDNPPNENAVSRAALIICLTICTVAVLLRLYGRFLAARHYLLVDYVLTLAYVVFVVDIALVFKMADDPGLFIHQWNLRLGTVSTFLHYTFIATNIFSVFIPLVKSSVLLEWLRIFNGTGDRDYIFWSCHAVMWSNVVFYLLMLILVNISCTPYEYNWNRLIPGGNCDRVNTGWTNLASASINLATDCCILIIPQRAIWAMHISVRKRFGVAVIFAIGILGIIAAGFRVGVTEVRATSRDFTHTFSAVLLCALAEGTCAILVVCGPAFPKAFSLFPRYLFSLRSWLSTHLGKLRERSKASTGSSSSMREDNYHSSETGPSPPRRRPAPPATLQTWGLAVERSNSRETGPNEAEKGIARHFDSQAAENYYPGGNDNSNSFQHS